jgi:hypothetical protein
MTPFLTILGGLFGGAGATLIWEMAIRPVREGRAFSRLLLTELVINRRIIAERIRILDTNPLPPKGFRLYTVIFDSSAGRLSELPLGVGALVYWVYRYFERLMYTSDDFWKFLGEHGREVKSGGDAKKLADASQVLWDAYLKHSMIAIDKASGVLQCAALPIWSRKRRALKATVDSVMAEMEQFTNDVL